MHRSDRKPCAQFNATRANRNISEALRIAGFVTIANLLSAWRAMHHRESCRRVEIGLLTASPSGDDR